MERTTIGNYRVLAPLAAGGMGELFLACRDDVAAPVPRAELRVIKRVLPSFADDAYLVGLFHDEARLVAQLDHPNICRVHEVGDAGAFIAMEYLHGLPLTVLMHRMRARDQALDVRIAVGIIAQACGGLQTAHDARDAGGAPLAIVHRDVSPGNLMVVTGGTVKVLDFGVAKARTATVRTHTGSLKGKCAYMAPEQVLGGAVDRRTDVFALAIVLYEMLTGTRLFKRANDFLTLKAITEETLPDAGRHRRDLPTAVVHVLERALQRDPERRFASAADLAAALAEATRPLGGPAAAAELSSWLARDFRDELARRDQLVQSACGRGAAATEVDDEDVVEWSPVGTSIHDHARCRACEPTPSAASRLGVRAAALTAALTAAALAAVLLWDRRDATCAVLPPAPSPAAQVAPPVVPAATAPTTGSRPPRAKKRTKKRVTPPPPAPAPAPTAAPETVVTEPEPPPG